jgi:predicted GNAT superfamily acetyltransferase
MNPAEKGTGTSGIDSDRLFASWELRSPRVEAFSHRQEHQLGEADRVIKIPADFYSLLKSDPQFAKREILRVREEFLQAFSDGLVCRAFERDEQQPRYLFYSA